MIYNINGFTMKRKVYAEGYFNKVCPISKNNRVVADLFNIDFEVFR